MLQVHSSLRLPAALAGGALFLAAGCSDSGADIDTFGGGSPPVLPLAVDFNLRTDLLLGASQVADALAVDLNGDGRADLVEANFNDHTLRVALRDALGGYSTDFVLNTTGAAWRLGAGDVNGDGLLDLISVEVSDDFGGTPGVSVFFQDAPGSFGGGSGHLDLSLNPLDLDVIPGHASSLPGLIGDLIVVAEKEAKRVSLLCWTGSQLLLAATLDSSPLGLGEPLTLAAVDLMADGQMDLVVGEVNVDGPMPDRLVVYPAEAGGYGAARFLDNTSVPVLDNVGDVDGNGFDDVGVALLGASGAQLVRFDAAGDAVTDVIDLPGDASSVVFGDFDASGEMDVAATLLGSQELIVRLSDDLGGYGEPVRYNVGFLPRAVAAVELTDDGAVDLLCASNGDLNILPGDGRGDFQAARGFAVGSQPVLVECVDLDNDEDLDAISVDVFQRQVGFLENADGLGHFVLVSEVPFPEPAEKELPGGFAVGDVDGDFLPDVVLALHAMGEVHVLRNPGSVSFVPAAPGDIYTVGSELYGVDLVDVNGDQALDVVVSSSGDNTLRLLLNDPQDPGSFTEAPAVDLPFSPAAILAVDLDGDEISDLAFTGTQPGGAILGVLAGDGLGNFGVENVVPVDTVSATLACGDFNGDGLCDLVTGQPALAFSQVWVYVSRGAFTYDAAPVTIGQSPGAVNVADVDRDGALDLLVPLGEGQLRVAFGDGQGGFPDVEPPLPGQWPVPDGTTSSSFSDVDGDTLPDLILVSPRTPNVWVGFNSSVEIPTP